MKLKLSFNSEIPEDSMREKKRRRGAMVFRKVKSQVLFITLQYYIYKTYAHV